MDPHQGLTHRVGIGAGADYEAKRILLDVAQGSALYGRGLDAAPQAPETLAQSVAFFDDVQTHLGMLNQVLSETAAVLDQVHVRTFGPVVQAGAENAKSSTPSASAPAVLAQLRDAIARAHTIQDFAHRLNARL